MILSIDFETRSTVELKTAGVYVYAQDPSTDIWCMAWAFDDEPPEIWVPHQRLDGDSVIPLRIAHHIAAGGEIRAWNAQFERLLWDYVMVGKYGAPNVVLEQWYCTAAEAAAMSLPRALDHCATVTGVPYKKDMKGHGLMLRMCRPRRVDFGQPVWWDVDDKKQVLFDYCKNDVNVERALYKVTRRLEPAEREVYLLDQRINDRGVQIDRDLINAAWDVARVGTEKANSLLSQITLGDVVKVTNHADLTEWIRGQGVETKGVSKKAVKELLTKEIPLPVREAITLRAEAGRTSIAKLEAMLACASPEDDRMRGLLLYHGASTGRWSGKLAQPHNFPKGEIEDIESYIPAVLERDYDGIDLFDAPIVVISSMLRSMMVARPGWDLLAADFSAIEARVVNWIAGQNDVLDNFRAYDAGDKTRDQYVINAMRLYRLPFEGIKKLPHRHTGKFQELGCGFGMGAKKAKTAAKDIYGLTLTEEEAKNAVDGYRASHTAVVSFWSAANEAAFEAVHTPGKVVCFGPLQNLYFTKRGGYLYLILPSKRPLCYAAPKIVDRLMPWSTPENPVVRPSVEISGINSYTRKWERIALYGGLITENIVQAVARDIMVEGMKRVERAGYPVILTVHDEVISEIPVDLPAGAVSDYQQMLAEPPGWAQGCPIMTEGWRGARYRK